MTRTELIAHIKTWNRGQGKKEVLRHLEGGKPLSPKEAIIAKCYDCMGGYPDGAGDCGCDCCPMYDFMPYRKGGPRKVRTMSQAQKDKRSKQMTARHAKGKVTK